MADSLNRIPLLATIPTGASGSGQNTRHQRRPYSALNSANREPPRSRDHLRTSSEVRRSRGTRRKGKPGGVERPPRRRESRGTGGARRQRGDDRPHPIRKRVEFVGGQVMVPPGPPERERSSRRGPRDDTTSPVAAFTKSGGPPRRSCLVPTRSLPLAHRGTYATRRERTSTAAICENPLRGQWRLVCRRLRPK